jgi:hypothetical protein
MRCDVVATASRAGRAEDIYGLADDDNCWL